FCAFARYFSKLPLRLSAWFRNFRFQAPVSTVRLQLACFDAIVENCWEHVVDDLIAEGRRLDWKRHFDAPEKIARHPICARKIDQRISSVFKIIDATVFQKTTHNADDTNVLA